MNAAESYYLDTSALLPYYREEAVSPVLEDFLLQLKPPVLLSDLTWVEFASSLSRWVRMQEIEESQASRIEDLFFRDQQSGLFTTQPLTAVHYSRAEKWLSARKTSLRTLDALHLACSWEHKAVLVTCDSLMHSAALGFDLRSMLIQPESP